MMKKILVLIGLTVTFLNGCGDNKVENDSNLFVTSEDWIELKKDITEEDYILAKEDEIITICIEEDYYDEIQNTIGAWKMLYPNVNAKIIKIPSDYDKAQIVLTELRTNIMAGNGPDIYIVDAKNSSGQIISEALFLYPNKAMNSNMFLKLDDYLVKARYMKIENYNDIITNVGRSNGSQYIIPLEYDFSMYIENKDNNSENIEYPMDWAAIMETENEDVYKYIWNYGDITYYFDNVVDYTAKEVVIDKEVVKNIFVNTKAIQKKYNDLTDSQFSIVSNTARWSLSKAKKEDIFWSAPNSSGGVTALVGKFAAIDANTKMPDTAFSFVDVLLSDNRMSGNGFEQNGTFYGNFVQIGCIPSNTVGYNHFFDTYSNGRSKKEQVDKIRERINAAMFYTPINSLLNAAYREYAMATDDRALDEIVDKLYDRIWMEINE